MSAVAAKRRYKLLLREQDRHRQRGSTDDEVDAEIRKLVEQYPELVEVKSSVSAATASMLAFAEHMMDQPDVPSTQESAPHMQKQQSSPEEAVTAPSPPLTTSHSGAPPTDQSASSTSTDGPSSSKGTIRPPLALTVLATVADIVTPYLAPSRTPRWLLMLVLIEAAVLAWLHRTFAAWAPCKHSGQGGVMGIVVDPIAIAFISHTAYVFVGCKGRHVAAYVVNDLLPGLVAAFVVYSIANMMLNEFTSVQPVRAFC